MSRYSHTIPTSISQMPKIDKYEIRSVLLAESIRQEISGQQSIIGLFTGTIGSESAPLALPQAVIRIEIEGKSTEKAKFLFRISTPSQVELFKQPAEVRLEKDHTSIVGLVFAPFILSEQGEYKIYFGIEGHEEHIGSFRVRFGQHSETAV
jgi:hypothetical protein